MTHGQTYLLYARVSPKGSNWSGGETSISVQLDECRKYVLGRDSGAQFIEIYDELKSGKNMNRAGVRRVVEELKSGAARWDCLVVWNLDRLTRSLADSIPLFQTLLQHGRGLISVRQNIDMFTAGGRFMLHIFIAAAQYEREMNSERTTAKMKSIARNGKVPYGRIPPGYRRVAGNRLEIEPTEAEVIRRMFDTYVAGGNMVEFLASQRALLGSLTRVYGGLLRNVLYIGKISYAGEIVSGEHEAIVNETLFTQAQEKLAMGNRRAGIVDRPGAQKYKYVLSGLVKCHCGRHMTNYSVLKKGVRYAYYKCTDPLCKNAVNAKKLDDGIIGKIREVLLDDGYIGEAVRDYEAKQAKLVAARESRVVELRSLIESAQHDEDAVAGMFTGGMVTEENKSYWNRKLTAAVGRRESLSAELERLEKEISSLDRPLLPEILAAAKSWADLTDDYTNDELRRNLALGLIMNIRCLEKDIFELNMVMTKSLNWQPRLDSNQD